MQYTQPICLTVGNFDGVHRGHQMLLQHLREVAERYDAKTLALFFEPQPLEFLNPERAPARLQNAEEKQALLRQWVDELCPLRFDANMQQLAPETFLEQYLFCHAGLKAVVVGQDFRFGHRRGGDVLLLKQLCEQRDIEVVVVADQCDDALRISSTQIRQALTEGQFARAEALLGHPYSMQGLVEHGDKRGRQIGVPTANIDIRRLKSPLSGVFIAEVEVGDEQGHQAVVNLGTRPTFDGKKTLLEVHLLNFDADCYGQSLKVHFLKKIRDEMQFPDFETLKAQIFSDIEAAKAYFADVKRERS